MLDVHFWELEASPVAWRKFWSNVKSTKWILLYSVRTVYIETTWSDLAESHHPRNKSHQLRTMHLRGHTSPVPWLKGTQDWDFFGYDFEICNISLLVVSIIKILLKKFLIGPVLGAVRFFPVVLRLRGMKKNFELGKKNIFSFFHLVTLYISQY